MIVGIGVDIVMIERIEKIFNEYGQRFLKKILGLDELNHIQKIYNRKLKIQKIATRFAAKEAFSKALRTGISKGINFNQIVVLNEKNGKPFIKLIENTKKNVEKKLKKKNYKISLSLSDEDEYAVAFVTISI